MRLALSAFCFIFLIPSLHADPIYKGPDPSGRVIYSSRSNSPAESPHPLPTLKHGSPKSLPAPPATCLKHGGINCSKGPDSDGSVICYDGFSDAVNRFAISCSGTKLSIVEIKQPDSSGRLLVILRNSRGVAALSPEVTYRLDRSAKTPLSGPPEVPPYGSAEFSGVIPKDVLPPNGSLISSKHLWITCGNCG